MKFIIAEDSRKVGKKAASLVAQEIKRKPEIVLGLASGRTMIPFYKSLVLLSGKEKISFSGVACFNLDEYVGLGSGDKNSLRYFMEKNFFSKIDIKESNIHFLDGKEKRVRETCKKYEKEIKRAGGIDLQILGIGRNGHIGFNEPGSGFKSRTREVKLSDVTRRDNSRDFNSLNAVPRKAITMGLGTIMQSRRIILLASGRRKAEAVSKSITGKITEDVPASVLQRHKNALFVLDRGAAGKLR